MAGLIDKIPVIGGGIAGKLSAMGEATRAAAWATVLGITGDAVETIKDPGFWIFLVSLPLYLGGIFSSFFQEPFPVMGAAAILLKSVFSSLVFLPLVIWFVQGGRGLLFSVLFVVWYFVYGASLSTSVLFMLIGVYILLMVGFAFLGKTRHVDVTVPALIVEDITNAVIPITLFFIDVGLVDWLITTFKLEFLAVIRNVIIYLPIWTLYGLWHTKKETAILNFLKGASVIYVVSILTIGLVPNIPQIATSLKGPALEDIQKAKQDALQKLPQGENPFISQLSCMWNNVGEPTKIDLCVKDRQARSKCAPLKSKDVPDEENQEYQECIKGARGEKPALDVVGGIDPTVKEFTQLDIIREGFSDELVSSLESVPFVIGVETPRNVLEAEVSCSFTSGSTTILGTATPQQLTFQKGKEQKTGSCSPSSELPGGSVTLHIEVEVTHMQTTSRLRRAFVGQKTQKQKDEIRQDFFPGGQAVSLAPPEFVRVNFALGDPPADPLIEETDNPVLTAVIENIGKGEITKIGNVKIVSVEGLRAVQDSQRCTLKSDGVVFTADISTLSKFLKKQKIPLGTCALEIDQQLTNFGTETDFVIKDFSATVDYNYKLRREFSLVVPTTEGVNGGSVGGARIS